MSAETLFYIIAGYLFGSILFARVSGALLNKKNITKQSPDQNPGTANAFLYGGFLCGALTLCGDMAKGFLPVFFYIHRSAAPNALGLAFVLAAPVAGHIFPIFFKFRGGKGIATSFGCLLGLLPDYVPLAILTLTFLFFSLVLRITPNYYRTILTYLVSLALLIFAQPNRNITLGFAIIVLAVLVRLGLSREERERLQVKVLWKH
ncbi:MAG: glycerol-3-phosphate acyltransferase [Oscillospiraceae bacterium]|nr:glycerol-3-phosphate acyltransferase [Oscillospiraceae bacterium]